MKEGRKLKSIDPMNMVSSYIMPHRNGASNHFKAYIDITETENFIKEKRREGKKGLGMMHIVMAAYVRTIALLPGINRFIRGQKIYARNGIDICLTIKKQMALNAPETVVKIPAKPEDTIDDLYQTAVDMINTNKDESTENGMDVTAKFLTYIPGIFLKFSVWLLKTLDYFGMLPKSLIRVSPFHGSVFFTNMGSLGIDPIYHHLYDFGNLPLFCAIGKKKTEYQTLSDGSVKKVRIMELTVVCDERICDGHYYATAFKTWKKYIEKPERLLTPPEKVVIDE